MEIFLLALSPLVVNVLTQGVKKVQTIQLSDNKKVVTRFIVVLLSFAVVLLGSTADGVTVDQTVIVTFVETAAVFMASQITYYLAKKAKSV